MINELKTFAIHIDQSHYEGTSLADLIAKESLGPFLHQQMIAINAPNKSVAASMLMKRYAFIAVSSTLYTMVMYNRAIHLPIEACILSNERKLFLTSYDWSEGTSTLRDDWREKVITNLFSLHITPLIQTLKQSSRVPTTILWENVAVRINSIYRKTAVKELSPMQYENLHSDFYYLKNAPGEVFGLTKNPISTYLKIGEELQLRPTRKTCCLYCKLEEDVEGIGYCANCPIKNR